MKLPNMRRRRTDGSSARKRGMLAELEGKLRRLVVVPLLVPVLLFAGAGVGRLANGALHVPDTQDVLSAPDMPRIRFELLGRFLDRMSSTQTQGSETEDFVNLYQRYVEPVEQSLEKRGVGQETARKVSWAVVENSREHDLDPATVLAVLLLESRGDPRATSFVGARGLMQVMPLHVGHWRGCGNDLYDIDDNVCMGTSILSWYLRRHGGDERRALLGYNGCVHGTNTRDCYLYPDKVRRIRTMLRAEWRDRPDGVAAAAAAP